MSPSTHPHPHPHTHTPTHLTRRAALGAGLSISVWLGSGCSPRSSLEPSANRGVLSFGGLTMGSSYGVKIATPGLGASGLAAAQAAVAQALSEVVALMSHYEPSSELSRLNHHAVGRPLAVSAATIQVFNAAQAVHLASGGAFDVALGAAVEAWGFGVSRRPGQAADRLPDSGTLLALQRRTGEPALALDAQAGTVTRLSPVLANLSGIAKGYGVDLAALALERLGIVDYLVEVGGEIRTLGRNGQGQPWRLAIERPDVLPQQALRIVPLSGRALATSGDYRNFFMQGGRRYSHEIDPVSAAPVKHALASVSVVADNCMQADAWSTALFVLGPQRGPQIAALQGLAAHFVLRQADGRLVERSSPAFDALSASAAA